MRVLIDDQTSRRRRERVLLTVTQITTAFDVITKYCEDHGIRKNRDYVLTKETGEILDGSLPLLASGVINEDVLCLIYKYGEDERTYGFNNWAILAAIALLIGVAGIIAVSILYNKSLEQFEYAVALDAGSTHTQLYVYRWSLPKINNSGDVTQFGSMKCAGKGISSYSSEPGLVGDTLTSCLAYALDKVPALYHASSPVYLGATAGMRLLRENNESVSDEIMSNVRSKLSGTAFSFSNSAHHARIISGAEEGAFSWLTVNYLLYDPHQLTLASLGGTGALDMGGASTQVTFVPGAGVQLPADYQRSVLMHGHTYSLYTHSYLCYGKSEAERRYAAKLVQASNYSSSIPNPCLPKGNSTHDTVDDIFKRPCVRDSHGTPIMPGNTSFTFVGGSNFSECLSTVRSLYNFSSCHSQRNCTFDSTYQPPLHGNFIGFSSYYYTFHFLNISVSNTTLNQTREIIEQFCSKTWEEIKDIPVPEADLLPRYCFDAVYIYILLTQGLKFNEESWTKLNITDTVKGSDLGWSLGFMLNETNTIDFQPVVIANLSDIGFALLLVLFAVFILFAALFSWYAYRSRPRRDRGGYSRIPTDYGTA